MQWNFFQVKAGVLIGLSILSAHLFAGQLFNTSRIGNRLSIQSNIPNKTYVKAGVLIKSAQYEIVPKLSSCEMLPSGYCRFSLSDKHPQTIVLRRALTNKIKQPEVASICLNAEAKLSCQSISLSTPPTPASSKIIGYLEGYNPYPPAASAIAAAGYTHVIIGFGVFSTSTPGAITSALVYPVNQLSYIQSLQAYGIKVLLSIGGASTSLPDTTVDFDTALAAASSPQAFQDTFIGSLNYFVENLGFDGFDFDIEHGLIPSGTFTNPTGDIAVLANIINTYHAQQPNKLLTLAPQIANISATSGFNETFGNYSSLVMQTYAALEWVGIQLYNSGCAYGIDLFCYDPNTSTTSPDPAVAFATDLLANWPAYLANGQATGFQPYTSYLLPSQVVLGYPVNNNTGQSDGTPAAVTSVIKRAIQCLNTKVFASNSCDTYAAPADVPYGIGGVFSWNLNYDETTNFSFATTLYPCVINGLCS